MTKTIFAFDLGTKCGWAIYDGQKIKSGVKELKATRFQSADMRFVNFRDFLDGLKKQTQKNTQLHGAAPIYFEEVRKHIGVDAAHCYGGFKATLTTFANDSKLSWQGVPVGTIKKHITGKGNADKLAVIKAVQALGYNPKDDNEADAIALLEHAMKQEGIICNRKVK